MEHWEEECQLFVLRMMSFIFKVRSVILPEEFHEMMGKYPEDRPSRFTPKITQATLILLEMEEAQKNFVDIDFLLPHSAEMYAICNNFNCKDFLTFCVRYGLHSVKHYLGGNMNAPDIVGKTIFKILIVCRGAGSFTDDTWEELDDHADYIIQNAYEGYTLETPIESSNETEEDRNRDELIAHSEFILRLMDYVFMLHFKRLPLELDSMLRLFSANPHLHFSPTVKHAVMAELNTQAETLTHLTEKDLEAYYETKVMEDFKATVFLEVCVCLAKKAIREYFEEYKVNSPNHIHGLLALRIGQARNKNQFTSWVEMEQAAIELLATYEERMKQQERRQFIHSLGEEAFEDFAPLESSSGLQRLNRNNRNDLVCPGCTCH